MVTYVVSAYDRPDSLAVCLWSLKVQTARDFECLIADNAIDVGIAARHQGVVAALNDKRFRHISTVGKGKARDASYGSADWMVEYEARGEWLCFPSDDSYYVPQFQALMLGAAQPNAWDLVYCDLLYDPRLAGRYAVLIASPQVCSIDKTNFMLRRDVWTGFLTPLDPNDLGDRTCTDGLMIERLVRKGIRHGRVEQTLCVHN